MKARNTSPPTTHPMINAASTENEKFELWQHHQNKPTTAAAAAAAAAAADIKRSLHTNCGF